MRDRDRKIQTHRQKSSERKRAPEKEEGLKEMKKQRQRKRERGERKRERWREKREGKR